MWHKGLRGHPCVCNVVLFLHHFQSYSFLKIDKVKMKNANFVINEANGIKSNDSLKCLVITLRNKIYWSKVLTDQQGLFRFFRKHKIVKNHLSNLLKRFFQKKSLCNFFGQKMESTLPKYAPSISQLLKITLSSVGFKWKTVFIY